MQQQAPQTMNQASPAAINVVSTEQIQKYLDENKNLIVAILENQNMGKIAECARYQAILQKNLMYLAAIADAQPPGSGMPSQLPNSLVATQGTTPGLQSQIPIVQQQQPGAAVAKSPFQLNALRPQDQQNQLLQFQQQLPAHFGLGGGANGLQLPGIGSSMGFQGSQPGMLEGVSGDNQGNSGFGPAEGRE
ncbi:GRF1-interacting factor 2-like [Salvia miltiorrhiza]|uniref:GRF1-interacting factor 2-like n=1 Tax=Salvia miltiorrhiza TaxID=226208 RepID=UPI0025AD8B35|nr:GRF1-interacting factor 2-like [Salvia miltiorrhiza]